MIPPTLIRCLASLTVCYVRKTGNTAMCEEYAEVAEEKVFDRHALGELRGGKQTHHRF